MLRVFCGKDERENAGFHVFVESLIRHTSQPVAITALTGTQRDGATAFTYSRFMVPYLCGFDGWAIWADGSDMLVRADIAELWDYRKPALAVHVVKHNYRTRFPVKFLGQKNEDYPRKNWSSLMLINCAHPSWQIVTPDFVAGHSGSFLHRLSFLRDSEIGELPVAWNHLVAEQDFSATAKIAHFTIGIPPFYPGWDYEDEWLAEFERSGYVEPAKKEPA